ncbi:MAG: DUF4301 family protein [Rikenellaceae bacterium]|nr:DUF4301 family protein [Rikenellaceae bacterium]
MFSEKDILQIQERGISVEKIQRQIKNFENGFPYLGILRAATLNDGIKNYSREEVVGLADSYDRRKKGAVVKFVPASGAATRMFKDLYEFLNTGEINDSVRRVMEDIEKFPFFADLKASGIDLGDSKEVISYIVGEGLNYGNLPKGLILFHKYDDESRTAVEEHLAEAGAYGVSSENRARIHFTVSPEHLELFDRHVKESVPKFEQEYGVKYDVTFSCQKPSTDTIAVDMENNPFREDDGSILFRPAGHGALLENLNDIDADIIFIKTVDNVVPDHLKSDTVLYKRAMAEILLRLQQRCFEYVNALECGANEPLLEEIEEFIKEDLSYNFRNEFSRKTNKEKANTMMGILNRPIRVCGIVRNEGEPGGGPFWVRSEEGDVSLQIAESAQIAPEKSDVMRKATHFNPVDIVCAVKDYRDKKFDLLKFTDPRTGFISEKSKNGRKLKAQELPGLWNGSMAGWNTVFVEVPISTFSPVKTVNDLLRPQHQ